MTEALGFLISGIVIGAAAGIAPGPLMALVLTETLKYGKKEGEKVAVAPLITDLPIILFVLFVLSKLSQKSLIIGIITLIGAGYLIYLGVHNLMADDSIEGLDPFKRGGLKQGVVANFLSPHPYLFWLTIGGPMVFKGAQESILPAVFFVFGFYVFLVGSKVGVSIIIDRSRNFVRSRIYLTIVRALGIALFFFALIFLRDGLRMIGILRI
jgi:threonine/homoserine/homoserine lactone efflux protein